MEYFISHIGILILAASFVALAALVWWGLTERNARLIRQRAEVRQSAKRSNNEGPDKSDDGKES